VSKDEKISKLSRENLVFQKKVTQLEFENDQLKRLIFGRKTERFVANEITNKQGSLFAEGAGNLEEKEKDATDKIPSTLSVDKYERKKANKNHPGRNKIPEHLPTREVIIEPEEDTTGMKKIGEEITETLEYTPASLVKKITRRPKYATADNTKILIGKLPTRPIEKGIAEASLLAHIFVQKFIDHLPFYRQRQIFKRNYDWGLPSSTINDWFMSSRTLLKPLYNLLVKKLLENHYLQADESPIKVLETEKQGSTH
jgi:transposase